MFELVFLAITCFILFIASKHDYKTKTVELYTPFLLLLCSILYMIYSGNNIMDTIGVVILTAFIFALPSLFTFGLGDFLIFFSLAFFIDTTEAFYLFLGIFLVMWVVWTIYIFNKNRVSKKQFWKVEYPLVPAITISFYVWIVYNLLFLKMA